MGDIVDYVNSGLGFSVPRATSKTGCKVSVYATSANCHLCGRPMEKKSGAYGVFWGCSAYPKCTGARGISK